jgi:type IV pilus assembly protein PilB
LILEQLRGQEYLMEQQSFSSSLIGQRLIEAGFLTDEQLRQALASQMDTGLLLGEVCLLKGWLTYPQLKKCLPSLRSKIGEKLLALGYISMEQLWLALLEQRHSGHKLGEILVDRGWIDKSVLDEVMATPGKSDRRK